MTTIYLEQLYHGNVVGGGGGTLAASPGSGDWLDYCTIHARLGDIISWHPRGSGHDGTGVLYLEKADGHYIVVTQLFDATGYATDKEISDKRSPFVYRWIIIPCQAEDGKPIPAMLLAGQWKQLPVQWNPKAADSYHAINELVEKYQAGRDAGQSCAQLPSLTLQAPADEEVYTDTQTALNFLKKHWQEEDYPSLVKLLTGLWADAPIMIEGVPRSIEDDLHWGRFEVAYGLACFFPPALRGMFSFATHIIEASGCFAQYMFIENRLSAFNIKYLFSMTQVGERWQGKFVTSPPSIQRARAWYCELVVWHFDNGTLVDFFAEQQERVNHFAVYYSDLKEAFDQWLNVLQAEDVIQYSLKEKPLIDQNIEVFFECLWAFLKHDSKHYIQSAKYSNEHPRAALKKDRREMLNYGVLTAALSLNEASFNDEWHKDIYTIISLYLSEPELRSVIDKALVEALASGYLLGVVKLVKSWVDQGIDVAHCRRWIEFIFEGCTGFLYTQADVSEGSIRTWLGALESLADQGYSGEWLALLEALNQQHPAAAPYQMFKLICRYCPSQFSNFMQIHTAWLADWETPLRDALLALVSQNPKEIDLYRCMKETAEAQQDSTELKEYVDFLINEVDDRHKFSVIGAATISYLIQQKNIDVLNRLCTREVLGQLSEPARLRLLVWTIQHRNPKEVNWERATRIWTSLLNANAKPDPLISNIEKASLNRLVHSSPNKSIFVLRVATTLLEDTKQSQEGWGELLDTINWLGKNNPVVSGDLRRLIIEWLVEQAQVRNDSHPALKSWVKNWFRDAASIDHHHLLNRLIILRDYLAPLREDAANNVGSWADEYLDNLFRQLLQRYPQASLAKLLGIFEQNELYKSLEKERRLVRAYYTFGELFPQKDLSHFRWQVLSSYNFLYGLFQICKNNKRLFSQRTYADAINDLFRGKPAQQREVFAKPIADASVNLFEVGKKYFESLDKFSRTPAGLIADLSNETKLQTSYEEQLRDYKQQPQSVPAFLIWLAWQTGENKVSEQSHILRPPIPDGDLHAFRSEAEKLNSFLYPLRTVCETRTLYYNDLAEEFPHILKWLQGKEEPFTDEELDELQRTSRELGYLLTEVTKAEIESRKRFGIPVPNSLGFLRGEEKTPSHPLAFLKWLVEQIT